VEDALDAVRRLLKLLSHALDKGDFANLWIPTHLAHDADFGGSLIWLLLEYIHWKRGTELQVLVQLPLDASFNDVEEYLTSTHGEKVRVFRDAESANADEVSKEWHEKVVRQKAEAFKEGSRVRLRQRKVTCDFVVEEGEIGTICKVSSHKFKIKFDGEKERKVWADCDCVQLH